MKYFKVKKEADQVPYKKHIGGWYLISGELFTTKEVEKANFTNKEVETYFDKVEASKKDSFFVFGARFNKKINR